MKFMIETGSESHTTSSASCQAKYHGGEYDGKFLYEVKSRQVSTDWHMIQGGKHGRWVTTAFELPAGTEVEIIGRGRTGNRGIDKHETHRIYRLDETAEVLDEVIDTGLRDCQIKGRLVLVRDVLASKADAVKQSQEEGF
jgi:hypothetical protein